MDEKIRISGVEVIGDIAWGTHFCHFYQTQEELMDILFPYLKAGLESNEICIWALSQAFETKKEAVEYLKKTIPELDIYLEKGQIEIIPYKNWFAQENNPDSKKALKTWIKKADQALDNGYDGLRLVQDISWMKNDWKKFIHYEEELDGAIENCRITAMCTYPSGKFDTNETIYMALNHRFVLVKREGKWEKIESPRLRKAEERDIQVAKKEEAKLKEAKEELEKLLEERTVQLEKACELLRESEKCLYQAQKMAHIGNWKWDILTGELHWSDEIYHIFGYDPDRFEATYDAFLSSVHPDDREYMVNAIKKGFNGELQNIDYRIIRPDGEERAVHTQAEIIFDEKNIPVRAEGIVQDITERKRVEKALMESKERYSMLFTNMSEAFFLGEIICDKNGKPYDYRFLETNPAFESHAGVKREKVLGKSHLEVFYKADPTVVEKYGQVALSGKPTHFEFFTQLTNKYIDIYVFSPEKGKFAAIFRDITERKALEEQTRQRAEEIEAVMEVTPVAIWIGHDPQCQKVHGNRMANEVYGSKTGENVSANITDVRRFFLEGRELTAEELPMQQAALKDIDVRDVEIDVLLPTGEWRALLGSASPLHDSDRKVRGSVGAFIDITERKKAEIKLKETLDNLEDLVKERAAELERACNSLKENERKLSEAQSIAHIGNWEWDLITHKTFWSDELYCILGLERQEVNASYDKFLNFVHPQDRDYVDNAVKKTLSGTDDYNIDFRIVLANGKERIVHAQGEVIFSERNSPVRIRGTLQDITERKQTEEALRLSEERYRIVAEQTGQLIYDYNTEEDTTDLAGDTKEITGYTPEEYKNINLDFLLSRIHPEDRKMFFESYERFLSSGDIYRTEYRFRKKNGEYIYVEDNGVCLKNEKGKAIRIIGAIKNITERREAEKVLENIEIARKREIHHRIKNNLQVISSLLDLQAEKLKNKERVENLDVLDAFRESQDRVTSIALIHEELHEGKGTDKLNSCPYLEKLIENLLQTYSLGNVDLSLDMDFEDNIFFDIDTAVPVGLIVNEIVSNSLKYAFSGRNKGVIRIKLCREENGEFERKIQGNKELDYKNKATNLTLAVSDNGVGLPENFNVEDSNTLGLQLISILVDQLEGKLELKRDSGTEFTIRFPVVEKK